MPDTSIVIVAAGPGRKMRAYSPKALIGLPDGRTVLQRQVDLARKVWRTADVVVVGGHQADRLSRFLPRGVRLVENERFEDTGSARSALIGLRAASAARCVLMMGDLVFDEGALDGLHLKKSAVLVGGPNGPKGRDVGVTVADGLAVNFGYGLARAWAGAALLCGRELDLFKALAAGPDRDRLMAVEVFNGILERRGEFQAVEAAGRVVRIDGVGDLAVAKEVATV